ncbi:hypothetical protein B0T10DRAFT_563048 [Thelonectria olida]|uniref:Uncharacterized protein n=1 Tax=Thelonectria olida TaxID=1576542 RepID=A0A9P9AMN7_9HYPO|nr:hypothetical protein B0T10DRAFT_563048 [Thelonectria olida]
MPSASISSMPISRSLKVMFCMGFKSRFRAIPNPVGPNPFRQWSWPQSLFMAMSFTYSPNGAFVPYEFQEGEAPSKAAKVPKVFFKELAEFLHLNNLAGLVALRLLDGPMDRTNTELLVGPQSTLTMDTKDVLGIEPAQITTGWFFQKNTHGVFQDSKPLPTLEALKAVLLQEGIIA